MPQVKYNLSLIAGDVSMKAQITREADHPNSYVVSLPAAKSLSSWVKTDANTAAGNLPGGHGYTDGKFDVFWSGGRRYNVDGTIVTNALSLDGGSGDDFPASANETVVACKQVPINTAIDGDAAKVIGLSLEFDDEEEDSAGHVMFSDAEDDEIAALDLAANAPVVFDIEAGVTNPFAGDPITVAAASNGSTENAATLKIISLEDSTP